jgi:hypothetical protein
MRWTLLLVCLVTLGCKGDPAKCEKGIRNYHSLLFWEKARPEIAAAPPEKRDQMLKDKTAELDHELEIGINMVVSKCTAAKNDTQIDCMIAAKTAQQARACSADPDD